VDNSAQTAVQERACINFNSVHTGSWHLLNNWNKPHAAIPGTFSNGPNHPLMSPYPAQAGNVDGMERLSFHLYTYILLQT
jgi:hypothetical protein